MDICAVIKYLEIKVKAGAKQGCLKRLFRYGFRIVKSYKPIKKFVDFISKRMHEVIKTKGRQTY